MSPDGPFIVLAGSAQPTGVPERMKRILGSPLVQILVLGAVAAVGNQYWDDRSMTTEFSSEVLVISSDRVDQIAAGLDTTMGREPTPQELTAAIDDAVVEEVLVREALRMNLERSDTAVRQRMIQLGHMILNEPDRSDEEAFERAIALGVAGADEVVRRQLVNGMTRIAQQIPLEGEQPLSERDLQSYLDLHAERYQQPSRVSFSHVFLSRDRHQSEVELVAARVRQQLRDGRPFDILGDPFPVGPEFRGVSMGRVEQLLGIHVARALETTAIDHWSEPITSFYGLHLVRVSEVFPAQVPRLSEVNTRVAHDAEQDRRAERLASRLAVYRMRYEIRVHGP